MAHKKGIISSSFFLLEHSLYLLNLLLLKTVIGDNL